MGISCLGGSRCFRGGIVRWIMIVLDILATLIVIIRDRELYDRLCRLAKKKLYKGSKWRR